MHLGNALSALLAWLDVRSAGGKLILRIEDLDIRARKRDVADVLIDDLAWLGLTWDEGPFFQSERHAYYERACAALTDKGLVYPCFCSRAELHAAQAPHASDGTFIYPGTCRHLTPQQIETLSAQKTPALRIRVTNTPISCMDERYGAWTERLEESCGDILIRRADDVWAYQLAVVVDDGEMGVTHVVRGHDLQGSVARQMYLQDLLGYSHPTYFHTPLLVDPSGRRLSKRDKDLDLGALQEKGVQPEEIIGFLASLLNLVPRETKLTAQELISLFSWEKIAQQSSDIVVSEFPC